MTIGYISKLSKHVGIGLHIYSLEAWAKCVNTVTAFIQTLSHLSDKDIACNIITRF